jgi:hypothetical protein
VGGLAILATEFVWARKLMKRFKDEAVSAKNYIMNSSKNRKEQNSDRGAEEHRHRVK